MKKTTNIVQASTSKQEGNYLEELKIKNSRYVEVYKIV